MITFKTILDAGINGLSLILNGDGTSKVLVLNLSKQPFKLDFSGGLPGAVAITTNNPNLNATGVFSQVPPITGDVLLTITFDNPPPLTNTGPSIEFIYNSQ